MPKVNVSEKGQLTLPAELRRQVGIKPHDSVLVGVEGDAIFIRKAPDFFELEGFLGKGRPENEERDAMVSELARRNKTRKH